MQHFSLSYTILLLHYLIGGRYLHMLEMEWFGISCITVTTSQDATTGITVE
jgi:hypothetical protein